MAVEKLTTADFAQKAEGATKPVLIDFFATWCGPCRMVAPVIDALAEENESICVFKVDVDEEPELANRFGVSSIPTLVAMKNGKVTRKVVGAHGKEEILNMLQDE